MNQPKPSVKYSFFNQSRRVQFFVILTFPLYIVCRIGLKVAEKSIEKAWNLAGHVLRTSEVVFLVCRNAYNLIVPKLYNGFVLPVFIHPIRLYIIHPVVTTIENIFDSILALCVTVWETATSIYQTLHAYITVD